MASRSATICHASLAMAAEAGSRIDKASNICFYTTKIMEGQLFQPYSIKKNAD